MILLSHIIVALLSLIFAGYAFISPSKNKLRVSYSLVALTALSGTYLIISQPVPLAKTCITGLAYLAFVSFGIVAAKIKLARQVPQAN